MLKRRIVRLAVAIIAAIGSVGGLTALTSGSALAATGTHTAVASSHTVAASPLVSCSYANGERVRQASWTNGNETRIVYLWYSTSTQCVWAVEVNGQPGDKVWVYNKDTGAEAYAYIQSGQHSATTGEINDAGTLSHACMLPLLANGSTGPKTCTTYF
jgi:Protein of unknown function (DUF2690)